MRFGTLGSVRRICLFMLTVTATSTLYGGVLMQILTPPTTTSPFVSNVAVSPSSVLGGQRVALTVTLPSAPESALTVPLTSSNPNVVAVPATATVRAGELIARLPLVTYPVAVPTSVIITAGSTGIISRTAPNQAELIVNPPAVSSVTLSPAMISGGNEVKAIVKLTGVAPAGGFTVPVTVTHAVPTMTPVTAPATVTVAAGQLEQAFPIATQATTTQMQATINAGAGDPKPATLTVTPPGIVSVATTAATAIHGEVSGIVTLDGPAPYGGWRVPMSTSAPAIVSLNPGDVAPGNCSAVPGSTKCSFSLKVNYADMETPVTITASQSGIAKSSILVVKPVAIASFTAQPQAVLGEPAAGSDNSITLNVGLDSAAPPAGYTVNFTSSHPDVISVPPLTVAAETTGSSIKVKPNIVSANTAVRLTAGSKFVDVSVLAPKIIDFDLCCAYNPATKTMDVHGTDLTVGDKQLIKIKVELDAAPPEGTVVQLVTTDYRALSLPMTTTVTPTALAKVVEVMTSTVGQDTTVTVGAKVGTSVKTGTINFKAPAIGFVDFVDGMNRSQKSFPGGLRMQFQAYFQMYAPPEGTWYPFSSSNEAVVSHGRVYVMPLYRRATGEILLMKVQQDTPVTLTIQDGTGVSKSADLIVLAYGIQSFSCPPSMTGGTTANGTVYLTDSVRTDGFVVPLRSGPGITVPPSVTIPAGQDYAYFPITSAAVTTDTPVSIVAGSEPSMLRLYEARDCKFVLHP